MGCVSVGGALSCLTATDDRTVRRLYRQAETSTQREIDRYREN